MRPVIFLNSHPVQYFAPLYQQISSGLRLQLTVWYCSDESIKGKTDKGFGEAVKWDIPLLEGYKYRFIKNHSLSPSIHKGFWGLFNPGIISMLYKEPKSLLIVHGWAYSTHIMAFLFGKLFGHTVCLRAETPLNQELKKNRFATAVKNIYLRFLFLFIDRFLYIGQQNKLFYESFGLKTHKLVFTPYSVDNKRFRDVFLATGKHAARERSDLPLNKKIILFSGKYISKKRPMDLLIAFNHLGDRSALLVFVGEGELRPVMEQYIKAHGLGDSVILTGFVNQSMIPLYYRAADIFVMCSGMGETWGLSVNEAMNFGLPVIISDIPGSAYDLVQDSIGDVFETGDVAALSLLLKKYLQKNTGEKEAIEEAALNKIAQYSYEKVITAIESIA
jgi:glycosyltransferase involved in cell wall biosynthesis